MCQGFGRDGLNSVTVADSILLGLTAAVQSDFNLQLLRRHREPVTYLDSMNAMNSRCPVLSEGTTPAQRMQMQQAQQQERLMQAPSQAFQENKKGPR